MAPAAMTSHEPDEDGRPDIGPGKVTGDFRDPIIGAEYRVVTDEMRGDLEVEWSGDELQPNAPAAATTIAFHSHVHRKGVFPRALHVKVTDADGQSAYAMRTVNLELVDELAMPPIALP
jgi:hypothetical protein